MRNSLKYTVFKTKWGYFGLAGTESGLCRSCLPQPEREKVKSLLLKNLRPAQYDKNFFKPVQEQVTAYFEGAYVNFSRDLPLALEGFSLFSRQVLTACRDISFGQTISYAGLAKKIGRPAAARAVGGTLARNPLPLIIPCHRVVCANGKIGGFSAMGGAEIKKGMLELEKNQSKVP